MANSRVLAFDATSRNRLPPGAAINALEATIEALDGTHRYTCDLGRPPTFNDLAVHAVTGVLSALRPVRRCRSSISGLPAVVYTTGNLRVYLAPKELTRLVARRLTKAEFFALMGMFGVAHDWHSDFYDFETGTATQPKPLSKRSA